MVSLTGNWTGEITGTNKGHIAVEIVEADQRLSGEIRINDLHHGVAIYDYKGHRTDSRLQIKGVYRPDYQPSPSVSVHGRPVVIQQSVLHGEITVEGQLADENRIAGTWNSSIGTGGTFWIERMADQHTQLDMNKVFVIHGRDEGIKSTVARFLEKLGLEAVVLHEQPNAGRTVIEKFEDFARVGFTVVLLTPDDKGGLQNDEGDLKPRARQNVIFELGYFIGKLGRKRVCALVKEGVEWPSDYNGVLYVSLDNLGAWKMELLRELKEAGYRVDANDAL